MVKILQYRFRQGKYPGKDFKAGKRYQKQGEDIKKLLLLSFDFFSIKKTDSKNLFAI
jgi:hypothetical protein